MERTPSRIGFCALPNPRGLLRDFLWNDGSTTGRSDAIGGGVILPCRCVPSTRSPVAQNVFAVASAARSMSRSVGAFNGDPVVVYIFVVNSTYADADRATDGGR